MISFEIIALVALALAFDFINGFHDAANSIATVVSTRVLSPRAAIIWAAFFNFIAFLIFKLHVANTIGKGIIDPHIVDNKIIAATLIGATAWDLITWYWGLPTSSSHALIGGFIAPVETMVAMELAASWKPFMKSNASASATRKMITPRLICRVDIRRSLGRYLR